MGSKVIIFTLNNCSHCIVLKNLLNKEKIDFDEIEIEQNKEIWDKVVSQTGHNTVPTVFLPNEGTDEGIVFVPERDYKSKEELIEMIKKHI